MNDESQVSRFLKEHPVGKSPWGADDQKGALNRITEKSRATIISRIVGDRVYDLSIDYFLGMPSFQAAGDPAYQIWMTHTPRGTIADNLNGQGTRINSCCGYSGDVILMYTHTGTHIDSLNHFGYGRKIFARCHPSAMPCCQDVHRHRIHYIGASPRRDGIRSWGRSSILQGDRSLRRRNCRWSRGPQSAARDLLVLTVCTAGMRYDGSSTALVTLCLHGIDCLEVTREPTPGSC